MKKTYVKPRIEVIELRYRQSILAGSGPDIQRVNSIHSQETIDGDYSL